MSQLTIFQLCWDILLVEPLLSSENINIVILHKMDQNSSASGEASTWHLLISSQALPMSATALPLGHEKLFFHHGPCKKELMGESSKFPKSLA